jgi:large subunit ribosomal protein L13
MKTIFAKQQDIERKWYIVDAENVVLGKLCTKVASLLRGKHKPVFAPHQEVGDYVIIVNADKVRLTGRKRQAKKYYRHSGYPGGIRVENFEKMISRKPVFPVEHAIKGMLPKNRLGRKLFKNVKVYAGPDHPHTAQKPEVVTIE